MVNIWFPWQQLHGNQGKQYFLHLFHNMTPLQTLYSYIYFSLFDQWSGILSVTKVLSHILTTTAHSTMATSQVYVMIFIKIILKGHGIC